MAVNTYFLLQMNLELLVLTGPVSVSVYSQVNSIDQADACKVTPAKFSGSKEVVPLHFRSQVSSFKIFCLIVKLSLK